MKFDPYKRPCSENEIERKYCLHTDNTATIPFVIIIQTLVYCLTLNVKVVINVEELNII